MTDPRTQGSLAALRHFAYEAAEHTGKRPGWGRWVYGGACPWGRDDVDGLIADGLLDREEEFMDIWVRPTTAGWKVLGRV